MKYLSFFFLIFFLASCASEVPTSKKHFETYTVTSWSVEWYSTVIAPLESEIMTPLAFKASGRIGEILVREGDTVKAGQILATLSNDEAKTSLSGLSEVVGFMGEGWVRTSLESLYTERMHMLDIGIEKAKLWVDIAKQDLELAEVTLRNSKDIFSGSHITSAERLSQSEKNLAYRKSSYENTKKLLDTQREVIRKNALSSMSYAYVNARNAREFADTILGITDGNKDKNDSYEMYLSVKKSSDKTDADTKFHAFDAVYDPMYTWYNDNIAGKKDVSDALIEEALNRSYDVLIKEREMLHALASVLENSVTATTFPESMLTELKEKNATFLSTIESSLLSENGGGIKGSLWALQTMNSNISLQLQQLQDAINMAENDLSMAQAGKGMNESEIAKNIASLETAVSMKNDALRLAQASLNEAEKSRELLIAERNSKISEINANISKVELEKNLAKDALESWILRAPSDGIITKKFMDAGWVIQGGMPLFQFSSQGTSDRFLTVSIPGNIVKEGDILNIYSLTTGAYYTGEILSYRSSLDMTTNKASAEVHLSGCQEEIGTRMEVRIPKEIMQSLGSIEWFRVPAASLIMKYGEPGIYLYTGGVAHFRLVDIMARSGEDIMIGWINPWDVIITTGKENILDGERLN